MSADDCRCAHCGKPTPPHSNYCGWACMIAYARANGGVEYLPNGLPIGCIRSDGMMFECENGDHPMYLFPVDVDGQEYPSDVAEGFSEYPQLHALVYTDGNIALTLYEANYALWHVHDGIPLGGRYQRDHERLSDASLEKIRALAARRSDDVRAALVRAALARAAALLDNVAAAERSLAEAEELDGDETHATMRRQNAWAFAKAAALIRPKEGTWAACTSIPPTSSRRSNV